MSEYTIRPMNKTPTPTPDLNAVAARALAEKITRDIMTDPWKGLHDRLVLEKNGQPSGGWSYPALCDRIEDILTGKNGN